MKVPLLQTIHLDVGYHPKQKILTGVEIDIFPGELISLTGHNGAGKSTLIKTITGLIPPLSGSVLSSKGLQMSLVPQIKSIHLEYPLTVERVLLLPKESKSLLFWRRERFTDSEMELIDRFQMTALLPKLLRECSGGQLQKVLILRALLSFHDFLILDEPVDALDTKSQKLAFEEFHRYTKTHGKAILIITHNNSYEWMRQFSRHYQVSEGKAFLNCGDGIPINHKASGSGAHNH